MNTDNVIFFIVACSSSLGGHKLFSLSQLGETITAALKIFLASFVTNVPFVFCIGGRQVGSSVNVFLPGLCLACFLSGVPVGPLFFTSTSGISLIMPSTVRWDSQTPWYPMEDDCGCRDDCGRGVARWERESRDDVCCGGVGFSSCGEGGGGSTDASDTTDSGWLRLLMRGALSFDVFLSFGGELLEGMFLTCWGAEGSGKVLDGEQSLRFLDAGRRSRPHFEKKLRCTKVNSCAQMLHFGGDPVDLLKG